MGICANNIPREIRGSVLTQKTQMSKLEFPTSHTDGGGGVSKFRKLWQILHSVW